VPELQRLRADHADAVLAFELENRSFFAATVSDRGEAFFTEFADRFRALLAEQDAGASRCFVLVDEDEAVLGRFNLTHIEDGAADLGYRMAQRAGGRGLASATVAELCATAALRALRAAVSDANVASRRVLEKNGFVAVGPADPRDIGGRTGTRFERVL
jgi:ribosomal-protein-alanine N-acetyltransferase